MSKKIGRTDMFGMACAVGIAIGGFNPLDLDADLLNTNLGVETGDVPVRLKHTDERNYIPTTRGAKRHTTWTHVSDLGVEMDDPETDRDENDDVDGNSDRGVMINNKFYTWADLDVSDSVLAQMLGAQVDDMDSEDEDSLDELDMLDDMDSEDDLRIGLKASDASRVTRKAGRQLIKGKCTEIPRRDYREYGPNTCNSLLRGSQWAKWGTEFGRGATPHRGAALTRERKLMVRDQYNVPGLECFDNEEREPVSMSESDTSPFAEVDALIEAGMTPVEISLLIYHTEVFNPEEEDFLGEMWFDDNIDTTWNWHEDYEPDSRMLTFCYYDDDYLDCIFDDDYVDDVLDDDHVDDNADSAPHLTQEEMFFGDVVAPIEAQFDSNMPKKQWSSAFRELWSPIPVPKFKEALRRHEQATEGYRRLQFSEAKYHARRQKRLLLARKRFDLLSHNESEDWAMMTDTSDEALPEPVTIPNFLNRDEIEALVENGGMTVKEAIDLLAVANLAEEDEWYHNMAGENALRDMYIAHTRAGPCPNRRLHGWADFGAEPLQSQRMSA